MKVRKVAKAYQEAYKEVEKGQEPIWRVSKVEMRMFWEEWPLRAEEREEERRLSLIAFRARKAKRLNKAAFRLKARSKRMTNMSSRYARGSTPNAARRRPRPRSHGAEHPSSRSRWGGLRQQRRHRRHRHHRRHRRLRPPQATRGPRLPSLARLTILQSILAL